MTGRPPPLFSLTHPPPRLCPGAGGSRTAVAGAPDPPARGRARGVALLAGKRARYSALPGLGLLSGKHARYSVLSVLSDLFGSPGVVTPPSKIAKVSGDARTGTKTPYQRRPVTLGELSARTSDRRQAAGSGGGRFGSLPQVHNHPIHQQRERLREIPERAERETRDELMLTRPITPVREHAGHLRRGPRPGTHALFPSSSMATHSDPDRSSRSDRRTPLIRSVAPRRQALPIGAGQAVPGDWPAQL